MRFTIRLKLFATVGVLIALGALIGVISISKLSGVAARSDQSYQDVTRPLAALGDARADINENRALTNNHILESTDAARRQIEAKIAANAASVNTSLAAVKPTLLTAQGKADFARLQADMAAYRAKRTELLKISSTRSDATAFAFNKAQVLPITTKLTNDFNGLFASKVKVAQADNQAVQGSYHSARTLIIVLVLVAIAIGVGIALLLTRSMTRAINAVLDCLGSLVGHCTTDLKTGLERMAGNDLTFAVQPVTARIESWPNDELGDVAQAVNAIRDNTVGSLEAYNTTRGALSATIGQVAAGASTVASSSQQMAATSEESGRAVGEIAKAIGEVASGAERQVRSMEETRSMTDEVVHATIQSAEEAEQTSKSANTARELAAEGVDAASKATAAMDGVRAATDQASVVMTALGAKGEQIGGIVATITQIAEQTNLLALNAAIEAARAGEQGRGFAVVAEEVRKLAEESQHAAGSIASLISEIQADTQRAVEVVGEGSRRTQEGTETVQAARESFDRIGIAVQDVNSRVENIAASLEQISASAQQMQTNAADVASVSEETSASTEQVAASTQQTSASTQQIAASAHELASTATELADLVGHFQIA